MYTSVLSSRVVIWLTMECWERGGGGIERVYVVEQFTDRSCNINNQ